MVGRKADCIKWLVDEPGEYFEVKPYSPKRTLTQNAYFHALIHDIAKKVQLSDIEVKNRLISEYGVIDQDIRQIMADDSINWERSPYLHLRPTTATRVLEDGRLFRVYDVMAGSHTLNTSDMAHLLDGTIQEAEQLGIATLPALWVERMRVRERKREEVDRTK